MKGMTEYAKANYIFDHAATTYVKPEVFDAMSYFTQNTVIRHQYIQLAAQTRRRWRKPVPVLQNP